MNSNNLEEELNKYAKSWIRNIEIKQQVISTKHGKFLKVNNGESVNTHITSILPARRNYNQKQYETTQEIDTYNECLNDCAEAIERANLVRCPSEHELEIFLGNFQSEYLQTFSGTRKIAKALLALLHRTAPQNVSNSATQEKI